MLYGLHGVFQNWSDVCFDITLQGYKHQKAYIIAEGPMLSTVRNMLKILYDRKVGAVVMLSGFMENGQVIAYVIHAAQIGKGRYVSWYW